MFMLAGGTWLGSTVTKARPGCAAAPVNQKSPQSVCQELVVTQTGSRAAHPPTANARRQSSLRRGEVRRGSSCFTASQSHKCFTC